MINMFDIITLKELIKKGILKFYIKDDYIYCENIKTSESIIVGKIGDE